MYNFNLIKFLISVRCLLFFIVLSSSPIFNDVHGPSRVAILYSVLLFFTPIHLTPYHLSPIYSPLHHLTPLSFHPSTISSRQLTVDIKGMFCPK